MPLATDRRRLIATTAAVAAVVIALIWGLASRGDSQESREGRAAAPGATSSAVATASPGSTRSPSPVVSPSPRPSATTRSTGSPGPTDDTVPAAPTLPTATPVGNPPTFGPSTLNPRGDPKRVVVVSTSGRTLVDADLVPSRLDSDGVLAPPFGVAGWYAEQGWARPGWPGASILAGHINRRSPKVELDTFGHLTKVRSGDRITVVYTSGQSVTFTATRSQALSKKAVPRDDSIWDASNPSPLLRLITCDPTTPVKGGHYQGNWVVWASLA